MHAQTSQLRALEEHSCSIEVLLQATGVAIGTESNGDVLAKLAVLKHDAVTRIARLPSVLPAATGVELRLQDSTIVQALEHLTTVFAVIKGPCAVQCTVAVLPPNIEPAQEIELILEMRYGITMSALVL